MTKRILSRNEIIRRDRAKARWESIKLNMTIFLIMLGALLFTGLGNAM